MRILSIVVASTVLVVAIALIATALADRPGADRPVAGGPLVSAVTGTTDRLAEPDLTGSPSLPSTPQRVEPSRDQWQALLPQLQAAGKAKPDDVSIKRKLALAYYNLGMWEEAAGAYRELLSLENDPVLHNRLGNTLRDMGDIRGAEKEYRTAIAADPSLAPPYINLAELLWRQGEDERALAVLDEGLKHVSEDNRTSLEKAKSVIGSKSD